MADKKNLVDRGDPHDMGVPMLAGDPSEPVGPEDATGPGPKRGDYRKRLGTSEIFEVVPNPDAKEGEPQTKTVDLRERAEEIGEVKGKKGGVQTAS
jgi:hypothetical protein